MNSAEQILDLLKSSGWCKGNSVRYNGVTRKHEYCLLGAAQQLGFTQRLTGIKLAPVVTEQFPERVESALRSNPAHVVVTFNDHPETTFEDVQMVLEKAIASETVLG